MKILYFLAAGAASIGIAAPAAAQYYPAPHQGYAQPVPQPYPGQPGYGYAQPTYGYAQPAYGYAQPAYGYAGQQGQNVVGQIINQLLGNRHNVTDRTAVTQCATAAMTRASAQYRPRGYQQQGYGQAYGHPGYNQGYNQGYNSAMRVTAVTDVRRMNNRSLRVSGLMSSGMHAGQPPYGHAYGYHNQRQAVSSDLTFRCTIANNGQVTNVRVGRNTQAYRR